MVGVIFVDAGLALLLLGALSLVRPLRWIGVRNRRAAGLVIAAGLASLAVGLVLPAPLRRVPAAQTRLDEVIPAYQFSERHQIRIQAPPERVFQAIRSVSAREIRFFLLLTWIRSPRWKAPRESILTPPAAFFSGQATRAICPRLLGIHRSRSLVASLLGMTIAG